MLRAALLPVVVMLPTAGAAFSADKRFNVYRFGGEYDRRPWGALTDQVRSVPEYLALGNFRPLGRVVERLQDLATFEVGRLASVPFPIVMRVGSALWLAALALAAVVLARTLSGDEPVHRRSVAAVTTLVPLSFAGLLTVANLGSGLALFADLYSAVGIVVLLVAAMAARYGLLTSSRLGAGQAVVALAVGMLVACFHEMAYLAVPMAVVAVLLRGLVTCRMRARTLLRSAAAGALAMGIAGFLLVAVPVRILIAQACAAGGCYAASALSIGPQMIDALGHRVASALPLTQARDLSSGVVLSRATFVDPALLALVVAVVVLALLAWRDGRSAQWPSMRGGIALAIAGGVLLLGAAGVAAASQDVQQQVADGLPIGSGWRETPLAVTALAMLVTGVVGMVMAGPWAGARVAGIAWTAAVIVATVMAIASVRANVEWTTRQADDPAAVLHGRIALETVSPSGDEAYRCALLREFATQVRSERHVRRLAEALDTSERALRSRPWCTGSAP